jgi:hypothetical protein
MRGTILILQVAELPEIAGVPLNPAARASKIGYN